MASRSMYIKNISRSQLKNCLSLTKPWMKSRLFKLGTLKEQISKYQKRTLSPKEQMYSQ